jgi:hypothetical protein
MHHGVVQHIDATKIVRPELYKVNRSAAGRQKAQAGRIYFGEAIFWEAYFLSVAHEI